MAAVRDFCTNICYQEHKWGYIFSPQKATLEGWKQYRNGSAVLLSIERLDQTSEKLNVSEIIRETVGR